MILAMRERRLLADPQTGYELNPARGFFDVVIAAGATNLVTNPSLETNTTGYTAMAGGLTRVATQQRRGVYSLEYTPNAAVNDGVYYGTVSLVSGTLYWLSFDFKGQAGQPYKAYFASTVPAQIGAALQWRATGRWQRLSLPYRETATTTRRLYVTKDNDANTRLFYLDGLQCEANAWPTTYLDGDLRGFIPTRTDFYWTGTPHASTSVRIAQSAAGGRIMSLKRLGFRIVSIAGLGLAGLGNRFLPMIAGGAAYQGTTIQDRSFTLVGEASGSDWTELGMGRQALIDLFKPDRVTPDQPVLLRYTPCDDAGQPVGEVLEIPCVFEDDLSGNLDNLHQERIPLRFRLFLPFVGRGEGEAGTVLDYQDSLVNADFILKRSASGVWSRVDGASAFNDAVTAILKLNDGTYAIGGLFTNAGGIADADYLVKYDPATDTLSAFNATPLSSGVAALALMSNGNVLVGGIFLNAGGSADADYLCILNTTTGAFSAVNATPLNNAVLAIKLLPDGNYAVGGAFLNAGGDANADNLVKLNGLSLAFSSFNATPLNDQVLALEVSGAGDLLIGGKFTDAGGDSAADRACQIQAGTTAFISLSANSFNNDVKAIKARQNGRVVIGGEFTDATNPFVAEYAGANLTSLDASTNGPVNSIALFEDGSVMVGGVFTQAGGLSLFDRMAIWNGSSFVMVDVDMPGASVIDTLTINQGEIFVSYSTGGTVFVSGITVVSNNGSAKAYPRIKVVGPGTVFQFKNWTTGHSLWFNLTLMANETAILDFSDPLNVTFASNLRGNLLGTILPGSSLDLFLQPGANSVSLFIAGTTDGNTAANMSWREAHHSLDGAIKSKIVH